MWRPPVPIRGGDFCAAQTAHVYVPPVLLSGLGEAAGNSLALLSHCSAGLLRFCHAMPTACVLRRNAGGRCGAWDRGGVYACVLALFRQAGK